MASSSIPFMSIRWSNVGSVTPVIRRSTPAVESDSMKSPAKSWRSSMVENDDTKYTVGYGKPPRHTRFKPGQSGNAKGRPKKATTVEDVLYEEFNRFVTITEGRKRRRLSKLRLVVRQNINKAANGDLRAAAMLLKLLGSQKSDGGDNLGALAQELRARNALLEAAEKNRDQTTDVDEPSGPTDEGGGSATQEAGS